MSALSRRLSAECDMSSPYLYERVIEGGVSAKKHAQVFIPSYQGRLEAVKWVLVLGRHCNECPFQGLAFKYSVPIILKFQFVRNRN